MHIRWGSSYLHSSTSGRQPAPIPWTCGPPVTDRPRALVQAPTAIQTAVLCPWRQPPPSAESLLRPAPPGARCRLTPLVRPHFSLLLVVHFFSMCSSALLFVPTAVFWHKGCVRSVLVHANGGLLAQKHAPSLCCFPPTAVFWHKACVHPFLAEKRLRGEGG